MTNGTGIILPTSEEKNAAGIGSPIATPAGSPPRSSTTGSMEMNIVSSASPSGVSCSQYERESSMTLLSDDGNAVVRIFR